MGDDEIKDAEQKVLFPALHTKDVTFLGKVVTLRPLPISISKKLRSLFKKANLGINDLSLDIGKYEEKMKLKDLAPEKMEKIKDDYIETMRKSIKSDVDLDLEIAVSILNSVWELYNFYKIGDLKSKEELDEVCSLSEAQALVEAQLELQGENDFLLKPLALIMMALRESPSLKDLTEMKKISPSLQDTLASASPGELDLQT